LIVQSDTVDATPKILICPVTRSESAVPTLRIVVEPTAGNGLRARSTVMINNIIAVQREKCGPVIGSLTAEQMAEIDTASPSSSALRADAYPTALFSTLTPAAR
jgi:mRNA interferase MazF